MRRRRATSMQIMPIEQQEALAERFHIRKDVRTANELLFELALIWITDETLTRKEFFRRFNASGHRGEYLMNPSVDVKKRIQKLQATLPELKQRSSDTPLDFSGAVEMSYVSQRIDLMVEKFREAPEGTMDDAIRLYEEAGKTIRDRVYAETGHWPEEFPLPLIGGRMTGEENPALFIVQPYQPSLLEDSEGQSS